MELVFEVPPRLMVKRVQGQKYRPRIIHSKQFLSQSWVSSVYTIQGRLHIKSSFLHVFTSVVSPTGVWFSPNPGHSKIWVHFLQRYILEHCSFLIQRSSLWMLTWFQVNSFHLSNCHQFGGPPLFKSMPDKLVKVYLFELSDLTKANFVH